MKRPFPSVAGRRFRRGFSLVEVTLALGVVSFGLVAVLGVLPVAFNLGRTSIAQTRAASLAESVFAGLRAQPFRKAMPGDGLQSPDDAATTFDLGKLTVTDARTLYAVLVETAPPGSGDPRRLRFTADRKVASDLQAVAGQAASAYELTFGFDAKPEGMLAEGQANQVLLTVRPFGTDPKVTTDVFRFATLIADRGGS